MSVNFIKLTDRNGEIIIVNAAQVVAVGIWGTPTDKGGVAIAERSGSSFHLTTGKGIQAMESLEEVARLLSLNK